MWTESLEVLNPYEALNKHPEGKIKSKRMKKIKWKPSIIIWHLEVECDEKYSYHYYFLTYEKARRFWEKDKEKFSTCSSVSIGKELLWLW